MASTESNGGAHKQVYKLVLTGGPCGGKTTGQERLATWFEHYGWKVFTVPETASILLNDRVRFDKLGPAQAYQFQKDLLLTLIQIEQIYINQARMIMDRKVIIICNRGALDPSVYMPIEEWSKLLGETHHEIFDQELAQIVDQFKNRKFAEKLQFRLYDCGKQTLHLLQISSKPNKNSWNYQLHKREKKNSGKLRKWKIQKIQPEFQASLGVAHFTQPSDGLCIVRDPTYVDCEFPRDEMPENIRKFERLTIEHLDDKALDFLARIKPLFTNVLLNVNPNKSAENMRILLRHLLPMIASIRKIACNHAGLKLLGQHFPRTLAIAKELDLSLSFAEPASIIPAILDCLNASRNIDGPKFWKISAFPNTIIAIVEAVRKQFLIATSPSTFVAFLEFNSNPEHLSLDEYNIENATTNEQMTIRNAVFKDDYEGDIHYVEILRHPEGANAKIREWIKERAYYEDKANQNQGTDQMISIGGWPPLTIGRITKQAGALDQDEEEPADDAEAGPSSSSAKKRKRCSVL